MEIKGEQQLDLSRDKVWDGLLDAKVLQACIPGCESFVDHGDGSYDAVVLASVGPVRARFKGRIKQREADKPNRLVLDFEGDSGMAGFAKGSATVTLAEQDGGTRLAYLAESQIGGRLAQIGSRLIDATVARMSKQFFDKFEAVLKDPSLLETAAAVPAGAVPTTAAGVPVAGRAGVPVIGTSASGFVLQMPAWAWVVTIIVLALTFGWVATS